MKATNLKDLLDSIIVHCSHDVDTGDSNVFSFTKNLKHIVRSIKKNKEKNPNFNNIVGIDIETTRKFGGIYEQEGLDPYLSDIVMVQLYFYHYNTAFIFDWRLVDGYNSEAKRLLKRIIFDPTFKKVGTNLAFEYKHFYHQLVVELNNIWDVMIADQIIHTGKLDGKLRFNLAALAERHLNVVLDKEERLEFLDIKSKPFTQSQVDYGVRDVVVPVLIKEKQDDIMFRLDLKRTMLFEMLFLPVIATVSYKGMSFCKETWMKIYNNNKALLDECITKLQNEVLHIHNNLVPLPSNIISNQTDIFGNTQTCILNFNSSKQVLELFSILNIELKDDKDKPTADAKIVKAYLQKYSESILYKNLLNCYLEYKELVKSCTTYGVDFLKHVNPVTNKIHSNYKQILNTGRISSSNPNLQNIPAGEHRSAFIASEIESEKEGFIINADYSGQEQIILANKSLEPGLIEFYNSGYSDMHSFITQKLYPEETKNYSFEEIKEKFPKLRHTAKIAGFSINYGGNGYTIAKNLGIDPKIGESVYNAYFEAFPKLKEYFQKVQTDTLQKHYILIDNVLRRKSFIEDPEKIKNSRLKQQAISKIKRNALNYPIQGEAGNITKLAAILFDRKIQAYVVKPYAIKYVYITNIIHDEINVEYISNTHISKEQVVIELESAMQEAGEIWCKTIPLKAEAKIVKYWSH